MSETRLPNYREERWRAEEAMLVDDFRSPDTEPGDKVSAQLLRDIEVYQREQRTAPVVDVIITFKENFKFPPFPIHNAREAANSPSNSQASNTRQLLAEAIQAVRNISYDEKSDDLRERFLVVERERYWLINGILASMPLSTVLELAGLRDVQYIQPADVAPPLAGSDEILNGRALIGSDDYFEHSGIKIAMLDSGVRLSHKLLDSPDIIGHYRDCFSATDSTCSNGFQDPNDDCNHGTASASILAGNNNSGNMSRGVTPNTVDSWKVVDDSICGTPPPVVQRGFRAAVLEGAGVISASVQINETHFDSTAQAANNAYRANLIVVAAAGNFGPAAGSVRSPANATGVLGVGAYDVLGGGLYSASGRGPTADGRVKPDLLGPTNTRAASNFTDVAMMTFNATSGATPYVAGAAALALDFLRQGFPQAMNANAYAFLLACGDSDIGASTGAGGLQMHWSGELVFGTTTIGPGQTGQVNFNNYSQIEQTRVAIWWADPPTGHNRISARLDRPDGTTVSSNHSTSVFQKKVDKSGQSGNWRLRIKAENVTGNQLVFYAAFLQ